MAGTNRPKKRLGQPVRWTDQQLEQMAQVSESDKQAAAVVWKENAPKGFEALLEAKVEDAG